MKGIRNVFREVFGLFVDDRIFALAILLWLVLVFFLAGRLHLPVPTGLLLFLGLAAILFGSVLRFAQKARR